MEKQMNVQLWHGGTNECKAIAWRNMESTNGCQPITWRNKYEQMNVQL